MAKTTIKYCKRCMQETLHSWEIDKEIAGEPIFWLICEQCGYSEQELRI